MKNYTIQIEVQTEDEVDHTPIYQYVQQCLVTGFDLTINNQPFQMKWIRVFQQMLTMSTIHEQSVVHEMTRQVISIIFKQVCEKFELEPKTTQLNFLMVKSE